MEVTSTPSPIIWACPLCPLYSTQQGASSFQRHLQSLHAFEVEEQEAIEPKWREKLLQQAFKKPVQPILATPQIIQITGRSSPTSDVAETPNYVALSYSWSQAQSAPRCPPLVLEPAFVPQFQTKYRSSSFPLDPLYDISKYSISSSAPRRDAVQSLTRSNSTPQILSQHESHPADFLEHARIRRPKSREGESSDDYLKRKIPGPVINLVTQPSFLCNVAEVRDPRYPNMIMQSASNCISRDQLVVEVRSIYYGLTVSETKAIAMVKAKMSIAKDGPLPAQILESILNMHKRLLNEHHDFFIATQHPAAGGGLHRLASRYSMTGRMWRYGIHNLLELLRHQLPYHMDFMMQFIIHAYQMVALLLETVPLFEETWTECLGDLSRYRMAVEETDMQAREVWAATARFWYCKSAEKTSNVGRLYHHLAVLARNSPLQQLYLYSRSLTSLQIFECARESIQTHLKPSLEDGQSTSHLTELERYFIKCHASMFYRKLDVFQATLPKFLSELNFQILPLEMKWREYGVYIASTNIGALFNFGQRNHFTQLFEFGNFLKEQNESTAAPTAELRELWDKLTQPVVMAEGDDVLFEAATDLFFQTLIAVLKRADTNCQPFLHASLAFLQTLFSFREFETKLSPYCQKIIHEFLVRTPWNMIGSVCNKLVRPGEFSSRFETKDFLRPEKSAELACLPEDWLMWGLLWTKSYHPVDWFKHYNKSDEEKCIEFPKTTKMRGERLLNIVYRLALDNDEYLAYSSEQRMWKDGHGFEMVSSALAMELDIEPALKHLYLLDPQLVDPSMTDSTKSLVSNLSEQTLVPEGVEGIGMAYGLTPPVVEKLAAQEHAEGPDSGTLKVLKELFKKKLLRVVTQEGVDISRSYTFPLRIREAPDASLARANTITTTNNNNNNNNTMNTPEDVFLDTAKAASNRLATTVTVITDDSNLQSLAKQKSIRWHCMPKNVENNIRSGTFHRVSLIR